MENWNDFQCIAPTAEFPPRRSRLLRRSRHQSSLALGAVVTASVLVVSGLNAAPALGDSMRPVIDGNARFQVISPTLIRMEYDQGRQFEDELTINVQHRPLNTPFRTMVKDGYRIISTDQLTLRYRQGSGPFTPNNVSVTLKKAGRDVTAHPSWKTEGDNMVVPHNQLGGWRRDLRDIAGKVALNPGILSRDGWQLVNDSSTALWRPGMWPRVRNAAARKCGANVKCGPNFTYQDGYFFGYGVDYRQALRDLATITGPSPVLPTWAFGNWYSNYHAFTRDDYARILGNFKRTGTPLDVLVVDTDYKAPNTWNGWNWNRKLWPNPKEEIDWLHSKALTLAFNTHDGMNGNDPKFPIVQKAVGNSLIPNGPKYWDPFHMSYGFDMSREDHARMFYWLHEDFEREGTDFFWFDYGSAPTLEEGFPLEKGYMNSMPSTGVNGVTLPGLNAEQWQTHLYAQRLRDQGKRGFSLSRHRGQLGERRNNVHFTGDTYSSWGMLKFQAEFTAAEGAAMGLPYVSHDVGGFKAGHVLTDDMYVRWAQFGAFQPINRPHGFEAKRLPWEYGPEAEDAGVYFLKLRDELIPYLYNLAWEAHLTGVPMVRALYLNYPLDSEAYNHGSVYLLGDDMLVTPVARPGKKVTQEVYFPAGAWRDYFTGKLYRGPGTHEITTNWMTMPVFIREGGIITTLGGQSLYGGKNWKRSRKNYFGLQVNAEAMGVRNSTVLMQDDGHSLDYWKGAVSRTPISVVTEKRNGQPTATLTISSTEGSYKGMSPTRSYACQVYSSRPSQVTVNGWHLKAGTADQARNHPGQYYWYDAAHRTVYVYLNGVATSATTVVEITM